MVEVGQRWKANPPGKEIVSVKRVWDSWDEMHLEQTRVARCHPVLGGRPLVIPITDLEAEFTRLPDTEGERG